MISERCLSAPTLKQPERIHVSDVWSQQMRVEQQIFFQTRDLKFDLFKLAMAEQVAESIPGKLAAVTSLNGDIFGVAQL